MGEKIAILGGTESWKQAPFNSEWKIWILGNQVPLHVDHISQINKIFEIHNDLSNRRDGYAEQLAGFNIPMIVGKEFPIKSDHIKQFPFDDARKLLGGDYLTSTPAYMMAYAILMKQSGQKITDIGIYGVDMAVNDTEYFYEQPVMKEWIGFAKGLGIRIHLPKDCPLGAPSYIEGVTANSNEGIEPFRVCDFQFMVDKHEAKKLEIDQEIEMLRTKWATHDGASQAYQSMVRVARAKWGGQDVKITNTVRLT